MKTRYSWSLLLLIAATANAQVPVLDQAFEHYGGYGSALAQAQTFVVGQSGRLVRVEVAFNTNYAPSSQEASLAMVRVIEQVPRALPDDVLAAALTRFPNPSYEFVEDADPPFQWVPFDLLPISVAFGEELALVVSGSSPRDWVWAAAFPGSYEGGMAFQASTSDLMSQQAMGGDFLFRTYVIPVGEPATSSLAFLAGGAAVHLNLRRRFSVAVGRVNRFATFDHVCATSSSTPYGFRGELGLSYSSSRARNPGSFCPSGYEQS